MVVRRPFLVNKTHLRGDASAPPVGRGDGRGLDAFGEMGEMRRGGEAGKGVHV